MKKATVTLIITGMLFLPVLTGFAEDGDLKKDPANAGTGFMRSVTVLTDLEKKGPDAKKWFFSLGGWYERKTGNTDTMRTNGDLSLVYDDGITSFLASGKTFYGENNGVENENNATGVLKYDRYVLPRVELFFFSQGDSDRMSRLNFRNNTGAGAKFVFFRNPFWTCDVSAAPVYQYEKYSGQDPNNDARGSFRFRIKSTPFQRVKLQAVYFYVPQLEDFSNYRTVLETFIEADITGNGKARGLFLRLGYDRKYNNSALQGTKKLDDSLYAQILLKL